MLALRTKELQWTYLESLLQSDCMVIATQGMGCFQTSILLWRIAISSLQFFLLGNYLYMFPVFPPWNEALTFGSFSCQHWSVYRFVCWCSGDGIQNVWWSHTVSVHTQLAREITGFKGCSLDHGNIAAQSIWITGLLSVWDNHVMFKGVCFSLFPSKEQFFLSGTPTAMPR